MAGQRQPIELVLAKGSKHLTKAEIKERQSREVKPVTDDIIAPAYLSKKQKEEFYRIAGQLEKLKIMGETDCDALGRYIAAQSLYEQAVKDLRAVNKQRPKAADAAGLAVWADMLDTLDKRVDRYFKQCRSAAADLGLTISSRCKLVVPVKDEPEKPESKFAKFRVVGEA